MFWITYDPLWDLYASTVLSLHFITHQFTNPLASFKGAEMEKGPLVHWSELIRMITVQWKRPSAEWWSDCSLVDCLVCGRPQWRTTAQGGPLGLDGTGSKSGAAISIGVNRGQIFPGDRWIKEKKKTVKFLQVRRSAPWIINCMI